MPSRSTIPLEYDVAFIVKKAGITNNYGWEEVNGQTVFVYPVDSYDAVQEIINNYSTLYLEVMLPKKIREIVDYRDKKFMEFVFAGVPVPLDEVTKTNLVGSVVGLERNESIQVMDWHMGDGVFVTLPRQFMMDLADAAFCYLQDCFTNARTLCTLAQNAPDIETLSAIDITVGWPGDPATPPTVTNPIADQTATPDQEFTFTIPSDTFSKGAIAMVSLANGSPLPEWLSFDYGTLTGIPSASDAGTLPILVVAAYGALTAVDVFNVTVG